MKNKTQGIVPLRCIILCRLVRDYAISRAAFNIGSRGSTSRIFLEHTYASSLRKPSISTHEIIEIQSESRANPVTFGNQTLQQLI